MKYRRKKNNLNPHDCGVTHFLNRVGGAWKVLLINGISRKVNRFSTLQRAIPDISKQSLANLLRELEEDKFIERFVYDEMPVRVEYKLTAYGESLLPVMRVIEEWGQKDMKAAKTS
jgi:DNA-binding HxlR family transcriptional regulator